MQSILRVVSSVLISGLRNFTEIFNCVIDKDFQLAPHVEPFSRVNNSLIIPGNVRYLRALPINHLSFMKRNLRFLGTLVSVLFLFFAFTTSALGQATVTNDKPDYAPRSNAVFTGAGF